MAVTVIEKKVLSSDKVHLLAGKVYLPDSEPRGIFQVVHGMTEHIERYDSFMRTIAEYGFICFGYDHLGHGKTANDDSELGFIASKGGWKLLVSDVANFAFAIRLEYGRNLPYVLMGHSMGSFIVRMAAVTYSAPDKLIIMGTGGPNPATNAGLAVLKIVRAIYGERHVSPLVEKLAFGSYNKIFGDDDPHNWLTKDAEIRKKYAADKFCTFHFTVSAMQDLITLNKLCNKRSWFSSINRRMPILLISGQDDPVGNYGKGVLEVRHRLDKNDANVFIRLYEDCRHEILNDTCKKEATEDILEFIYRH
ncbi:MAG: alpha/beta fold hydrolase [Oscillospiraceae bacterium]|nr:alpha/beta fold hydrolase [Oscillospiraceae bacterium]MBQ5815945.1 alpha/beta fold hydrolase [Oscillospiraceae bacterium]